MVTQLPDGSLEFRFFRAGAHQVALAGDFNNWQPTFQLKDTTDGWWVCRLMLAPGIYQFRYLADGQWFNDYAAFGLEHGPFGLNSVACIEGPRAEADSLSFTPPDGPTPADKDRAAA